MPYKFTWRGQPVQVIGRIGSGVQIEFSDGRRSRVENRDFNSTWVTEGQGQEIPLLFSSDPVIDTED